MRRWRCFELHPRSGLYIEAVTGQRHGPLIAVAIPKPEEIASRLHGRVIELLIPFSGDLSSEEGDDN